ncbi:MAG TPA: hypothetical protein VE967_05405 [Gemmatimonadaceae bacterium]|nr:hypothetical protein [Gemmatimonadaceae bacterium]
MIISLINHSNGRIHDDEIQTVVRAINRQITGDFEPYWSLGARLRLEGRSEKSPSKQQPPDMRGDAVIYIWPKADVDDALGYHDANNRGIPYGFIFLDIIRQLKESWTVTLSHEVLEAILDPEANLLVQGPHPTEDREVFHWYEASDAVQAESYMIDGVAVSNFVLPLYFTSGEETGGRNDFLGTLHGGKALRSFGVNPGGYIGFYDPKTGDHETFVQKGDRLAVQRARIKAAAHEARRAARHTIERTGMTAVQAVKRARRMTPLRRRTDLHFES